jgi:4'-phosphopantetheinyl transferase
MFQEILILLRPLSAAQDLASADILGTEDSARAQRFHFPEDRARFLLGRALLHALLQAVGCADTTLDLVFTPLGKPALRHHPEIHFSITHSGDFVAVAAARETIVGIDLERIPPGFDHQAIAARVLSSAEQQSLLALPPERRLETFFQAWTGKEAVLKARGTGIAGGMPAVAIPLEPSLSPRALDRTWMIQGLPLPAGYMGNIVWNDPTQSVRFLNPTTG